MPDLVTVFVNGRAIDVPRGTIVSAALLNAEQPCRISVSGERRTAVCGMGICFECRAVVNGVPHTRTCQIVCEPGMTLETQQ